MLTRLVVVVAVMVALTGGAGVAAADASDNAKACPEDGNPSVGLETSIIASQGASLNAADGVNRAFERVGCDASIP